MKEMVCENFVLAGTDDVLTFQGSISSSREPLISTLRRGWDCGNEDLNNQHRTNSDCHDSRDSDADLLFGHAWHISMNPNQPIMSNVSKSPFLCHQRVEYAPFKL